MMICGGVGVGKSHVATTHIPKLLQSRGIAVRFSAVNCCNVKAADLYDVTAKLIGGRGVSVVAVVPKATRRRSSAATTAESGGDGGLDDSFESSSKKSTPVQKLRQKIQNLVERRQRSKQPPVLLFLDEIDNVARVNGGAEVVRQLVLWATEPSNLLLLICIGNQSDFVESRFCGLHLATAPVTVHFRPYDAAQMQQIVMQRLLWVDFFEEKAISFYCQQMLKIGADVRKLLSVCQRLLERHKARLLGNSSEHITIAHILPVLGTLTGAPSCIAGLPFHQQALLCAVVLLQGSAVTAPTSTLRDVHESYARLCRGWKIPFVPLSQSLQMFDSLVCSSVVALTKKDVRNQQL
eukprot:TRINITY_DN3956_c0_g1_i6.p1 TRINITY_DN3956_c0_g1~~TRINITY_DN3956_c0_g1_i6.p1  ORF type:complete len:351 (-),score=76.31 TRINITY_DN3956_c0_g1_i6:176-1228(-)